jgi:hypothetical protein
MNHAPAVEKLLENPRDQPLQPTEPVKIAECESRTASCVMSQSRGFMFGALVAVTVAIWNTRFNGLEVQPTRPREKCALLDADTAAA